MNKSNAQKLILPVLVAAVILFIYFFYFAPTDELGLFSKFDTNSNSNRDIIVKVVVEKGFMRDQSSGSTIFYVLDKANREVKVSAPLSLPPGIDDAKSIVLRGHLHSDYFHAAEVVLR
ncbi:MAG: cytochrome c maturation protein CcmE [Bacteroidetes bacterium]|nr:cytochrome c maturation protein CcmE [Bacteroidota bacterium]MBU1678729.1 cytochrome c maturation protein CcmE [Bacteroidota bacterium]